MARNERTNTTTHAHMHIRAQWHALTYTHTHTRLYTTAELILIIKEGWANSKLLLGIWSKNWLDCLMFCFCSLFVLVLPPIPPHVTLLCLHSTNDALILIFIHLFNRSSLLSFHCLFILKEILQTSLFPGLFETLYGIIFT